MTKINFSDKVFFIILIGKALFACLQMILGVILFFVNKEVLNTITSDFLREELIEEPNDVLATKILNATFHISGQTQLFLAFYLLIHGLVKIGLVYGLYKQKLFVYPLAAWIFFIFLLYQIYRYFLTSSVWLLALSILDVFFIYLIMYEYKKLGKKKKAKFTTLTE